MGTLRDTPYLVWLKRAIERNANSNVVNLATSGVFIPEGSTWLHTAIESRLPEVATRLEELNEFGLASLKAAIRHAYALQSGRDIVLTSGASGGLRFVCEFLFAGHSGFDAIVESPSYEPLVSLPKRFGARILSAGRSDDDEPTDFVDQVARLTSNRTRAILISNLHNPTGHWLNSAQLSKLAAVAKERCPHAAIVVDETFADLGPSPGSSAAEIDRNIITVSGLSKAYGLGSLRCGWVTADASQFPNLMNDWVLFENIGPKLLEVFGAMAFSNLRELRHAARAQLAANHSAVAAWMDRMIGAGLLVGHIPEYGCVAFPQLANGVCADDLVARLESEFGVLVAPGRFFGVAYNDRLRIGFGGEQSAVAEGLVRLERGLHAVLAR